MIVLGAMIPIGVESSLLRTLCGGLGLCHGGAFLRIDGGALETEARRKNEQQSAIYSFHSTFQYHFLLQQYVHRNHRRRYHRHLNSLLSLPAAIPNRTNINTPCRVLPPVLRLRIRLRIRLPRSRLVRTVRLLPRRAQLRPAQTISGGTWRTGEMGLES